MWRRGVDELIALGISPEEWLSRWRLRIQRGDAVMFGSHAILGCDWDGEICSTVFQASRSFEEPGVGRAVTKEMRRVIPRLMEERGVTVLHTYSLCISPEAEKWFRLLGLTEDTNYQGPLCGPFRLRRFVRRV